ncbi:MAG: NDP-sugar synthase, partial [Firmicutes bacterium]|nr:NDP-sugar synthase [Bacillota bacterium]
MKGIIMAGGEGSRLRPLTCDLPKPMVPVMNRPVMSYSIELLKKYRITDIGVTLQYLPEEIQDYFQNGTDFGVHLNYFIEDSPLGTAGSVKNSGDFLDETFVVISGDALTDINLEKAIKFHKDNGSIATLILKRVEVPLEFGVVVTDEEGSIKRFLEKPNWGEVFSDTVNTGIYILEPEVLDYFEAGKKFDFSQDLFPLLLKDQRPMFGYITNEYWCDIGNSQTYLSAHYDMLSGRVNIPMPGRKTDGDIWLGENVQIHKDAKLEGPCFIGDYSKIGKDVYIGPYTVVGSNCSIDSGSSIKKSILWNHVVLGEKTAIRGAALCNKVDAANRVSVFEGAIIGDGCQLKEGSVIKPLVKIWPNKTVDEGNIIQSNIIWGTKSAKTLF